MAQRKVASPVGGFTLRWAKSSTGDRRPTDNPRIEFSKAWSVEVLDFPDDKTATYAA